LDVSESRKLWVAWIAAWLAVAHLLLAGEAAVRLLLPHEDAVRFFADGGGHAHDAEGARSFMGDPDLGWRLRPGLRMNPWLGMPVTTTRDGFRSDHEFPRPPRGRRVVCVGDSVTFGYGLISPDQVYPGVLERLLRERLGEPELDVVPMGVPAYSSLQGRLWLEREIAGLRPDLVTILFGFNDTAPGGRDAIAFSTSPLRRAARHLVYESQALTHVLVAMRPLLASTSGAAAPYHPRVTTAEYLDNIRSMIDLAQQHGARVVVLGQVFRDANPERPEQNAMIGANRRALAAACAGWNVPYLEVTLLTEASAADNGGFFVDREHPGPLGQRLLAERLLDIIDERNLLSPRK
jgi:lysophospholipase L1-like esterase